ncbi:MAG: hypothetical protein HXS46_05890 [Theionarchaea archaeon]|nr:hypothetical protein [Theionarchaea archaeon]
MSQTYQRINLAVPVEKYKEFEIKLRKIKKLLGVESTNAAIVKFVLDSERILFEAQRYRRILEDTAAYEASYEKTHKQKKREGG